MASFRSLHQRRAAKAIAETGSLLELAKLEAEEIAGGEHRPSLVDDFTARARTLVAAGVSEDQHIEVLEALDGVSGSLILAALGGDSHGDDDTVSGETRSGGESPSEAAEMGVESAPASLFDGPAKPAPMASPKPRAAAPQASRRPMGRLIRQRQPDGTIRVLGVADLRRGQ